MTRHVATRAISQQLCIASAPWSEMQGSPSNSECKCMQMQIADDRVLLGVAMLKLSGAIFLASNVNKKNPSSSKNPAKTVRRGPVVAKWYTRTDVTLVPSCLQSCHIMVLSCRRLVTHPEVSAEKRRKCQVRARGISIWRSWHQSIFGSFRVITGKPKNFGHNGTYGFI